jgi:hypothetical protein
LSRPQTPAGNLSLVALSAGTRVAGAVVALGYLTGWIAGPLPAAVMGLALMTFGRCLALRRSEILPPAVALGVVAVATGAGGLRWATLDLGLVRGAQAVLGPTVTVGPAAAVAGSLLAAGACVVALAVWLTSMKPPSRRGALVWASEAVPIALLAVTVFWGPKVVDGASDVAAWAGVTLAIVAVAGAIAALLWRVSPRLVAWLLLPAWAAAVAGGGLIAVGI